MIGVYGGTFDPIHYGHLRTALEVKELLGLAEVRFVPCRQPPHRHSPAASPEQRLAMLQAALQDGEPGFRIDTRELERSGTSFTVDTLTSIRAEIGARPLGLILGLDAFLGLHRWHRWQDLFELAHIIVMQRPGPDPEFPAELVPVLRRLITEDPAAMHVQAGGLVLFAKVTQLGISATAIRAAIQAGRSPRYLVPDAVLRLLARERLYQSAA